MKTYEELIEHLIYSGRLRSPHIIRGVGRVDRALFVADEHRDEAYMDYPLSIGFNQTISQPSTVAMMMEWLYPERGNKILDIGAGSGWTTAILAEIAGPNASVTGTEIVPELVEFANQNLEKAGIKNAEVVLTAGDVGIPEQTFDRILVSASARFLPDVLFSQLKVGGTMVIPIRNSIYVFEKVSEIKIDETEYPGFVFVPLIH
ncbi:protein-L-isoaspartate O-methyltransferase [Thermoproteota archaeon]